VEGVVRGNGHGGGLRGVDMAGDTLTDAIRKALPRIREMGREEIEKTHAAGQPVHVSDSRGGIVRLDPDGSRHAVRQP
jgi:hypothetical protein